MVEENLKITLDNTREMKTKFDDLQNNTESNFIEFETDLKNRSETLVQLLNRSQILDANYKTMIEISRYYEYRLK